MTFYVCLLLIFQCTANMALTKESRASSISPFFIQLAPSVHFYHPSDEAGVIRSSTSLADTAANSSPSLILLFTWTGACPSHIAKYIAAYRIHYPNASILIITTSIKFLVFHSSTYKSHIFRPIIRRLLPITNRAFSPQHSTRILLHSFSEGGSSTAVAFAQAYKAITGTRIPVYAFVLDSTPGAIHYMQIPLAVRAAASKHNVLVRVIGLVAAYAVTAAYAGSNAFVRNGDSYNEGQPRIHLFSKTRVALNDECLWPVRDTERIYLFGSADPLFDGTALTEHAAEAERRGAGVHIERFEGAGHCALPRGPGAKERYWNVVVASWERTKIRSGQEEFS